MAGTVRGRYFKLVVSPLLEAGAGSKALIERVAATADDDDVAWEDFAAAVASASATVGHRALVELGQRIFHDQREEFERWGFDSAEAMLTDLDGPLSVLMPDPPESERMITAKYEPGHALFLAGLAHPSGLLEGYLRAIVELHQGSVHELACHQVRMDGRPYHLIELRWWTPSRVMARRRPASGPRLVA